MVKPIALTPMPSASATTAAAENQGSLAIRRRVKRKSCSMEHQTGSLGKMFRVAVGQRLDNSTAIMFYPLTVKKAALVYGLCGGMLIIALRLAEYRFLVVEHSVLGGCAEEEI